MIRLELLFAMQMVMAILMIFFLQKITQMKKQVDQIIKEVEDYVSFITKEEPVASYNIEEKADKRKGLQERASERFSRKEKEEEQSRLIQAVLGEYFP